MTKRPITKQGYEQLKKELERLKRVERPKIIQEIAEARSHGDISENAEYHAAKERQSFIEGKIREIESKLAHFHVIDTAGLTSDKVVFGATVLLHDIDNMEERRYALVGQEEADLKNGRISVHSPVGRALIGHRAGDVVKVTVPSGTVEYEILEIYFEDST